HPAVVLDVITDETVLDLTRQEADLALRFVRPMQGDLVSTRAALLRYGVFASPEYLAGRGATPGFADLEWIGLNDRFAHLPEAQWLARHAPPPVLRTNSFTLQFRAAEAGLGAVLTPAPAGELSGTLVPLHHLAIELPEPAPIWLVTHRVLRDVPRVAAVWDWLLAMCAEWLA
ncbi:MAG: LysR family transcriptional regulator, partial [Myxococcales bacterium]|nr:LysR family transcriptional regulator [Myxococcales bacterium]